jgi:hypothetical protein
MMTTCFWNINTQNCCLQFFLGMALLMTVLFTREWIGDAVPLLVVPIAALAFTPLGEYVAGKVNGQKQTTSQRYRPGSNGNGGTETDSPQVSPSYYHAARRPQSPDNLGWGTSNTAPIDSQRQSQSPVQDEWSPSSDETLYSGTSACPSDMHPAETLQQGSQYMANQQEVSSGYSDPVARQEFCLSSRSQPHTVYISLTMVCCRHGPGRHYHKMAV